MPYVLADVKEIYLPGWPPASPLRRSSPQQRCHSSCRCCSCSGGCWPASPDHETSHWRTHCPDPNAQSSLLLDVPDQAPYPGLRSPDQHRDAHPGLPPVFWSNNYSGGTADRTGVIDARMEPLTIVEHLDVVEQCHTCLLT